MPHLFSRNPSNAPAPGTSTLNDHPAPALATGRRALRVQRRQRQLRRRWIVGAAVACVLTGSVGSAALVSHGVTAAQNDAQAAAISAAAALEAREQVATQSLLQEISEQKADQAAIAALGRAEAVIASAEGVADTGTLRSTVAALGEYRTLDPAVVESLSAQTHAVAEDTAAAEAAARELARVNTPEGARDAARELASSMHGWGDSQFSCLNSLWQKESGWRYDAYNASSGATGIPQSLPGSKMATAGADWQTNARTQIVWGLDYIKRAYGTPCSAWAHSQSVNWY